MIDAHCHLQFNSFRNDYDEVAKRAFDAGVKRIINTGTQLESSYKAVDFANAYEQMYAIIGVHPHHADKLGSNPKSEIQNTKQIQNFNSLNHKQNSDWIGELEEMAKHPKVIGVGEIGIDYFSYKSNGIVDPGIQKDIFIKQIEMAYRMNLPLQIHNRQAGKDIIEILQYYKDSLQPIPGMLHCFAGNFDLLKSALKMGFYIGMDGNVTYKGLAPGEDTDLKDIAKYIPVERLIVETDSPYLAPVPYRGLRNEPKNVIVTAEYLAQLKQIDSQSLINQTTNNVFKVFPKLK